MPTKAKKQKKIKAKARTPKPKLAKRQKKAPVTGIDEHPAAAARPKGGDSDRGLYVRFESREIKEKVQAAAKKTGASMNAYIVAAALEWVEKGRELELPAKEAKAG